MPRSRPAPIAHWSSDRDVWETDEVDLLSESSDVYSEAWPTSGTTRNGSCFPRPAWEPATDETGYSLLPTPRATMGGSHTETLALLPTPEANTATNGGSQDPAKRRAGGHSVNLQDVVEYL